jgi:glycosyltransferase involved in cell wall biosynthesis
MEETKVKVLFIMEDSVPIEDGGCPIRNRYVMEILKSKGLEIAGLTSPFMRVIPGEITEGSEVINGIRYYRSQYLNTIHETSFMLLRWAKRFQIFRRYCGLLEDICSKEKPDLIHAITSYFNGNAANRVGRKLNIPRLYEVRSIAGSTAAAIDGKSHDSFKYQIVWKLDKRAMLEATRVAPLSNVLKEELVRRGIHPDKVDVVHNVVDTNKFAPQERSLELVKKYKFEGKLVIGFIGSIRKIEGLSILVEAAPVIKKHHRNVEFMIVGDGAEMEYLKELARKHNVLDSFIFPGRVPHSQIVNYYSVIDIFVLPRINALVNRTVSPLKPLEIMAIGKVVVASDVPGFVEPIKDGKTGILFKTEDKDDFTRKILEIAGNAQRLTDIGKEARKWIIENREMKTLIDQYVPVYEKILNMKIN